MSEKRTVHCLVCEKALEIEEFRHDMEGVMNMIPGEEAISGPYGGLVADAHGNYGSTVFDPLNGHEFLRFYVCDKCIVARKQHVEHHNVQRKVLTDRKPWES